MVSAIVFLPLLGAALIGVAGRTPFSVRTIALATGILDLLLSLVLFATFSRTDKNFQSVELIDWIPALNIQYLVGVDGLSMPLLLLTSLLGLVAVLASWNITIRIREYFIWLLLLQTAVSGVFVSLDLVLFFLFWELELIPMFMLISIWGTGRREYSAMKFLTYTLFGSAFMLAAILTLYFSVPIADRTFDIRELMDQNLAVLLVPSSLVFIGFFIAFAIKLPVWPMHTWLPDAHTDAPTAVSVMLAGVLLKMGGYGLIRINIGLFPDLISTFAPFLAGLATMSVLYGAFAVLRQTDLKRLIAYSSVSHMGFVLLGIASVGAQGQDLTSVGLNGAALQLFTHGTITGLLFVVVGLIYDRTHTRHIPDLGGLMRRIPIIGIGFIVAGLASLGLPSTSGFAAELLIFLGTFSVFPWATALSALGVVLAAGYILWTVQRTFFGPSIYRYNDLQDARLVDAASIGLLILPIMVVGVYPKIITGVFDPSVFSIISRIGG